MTRREAVACLIVAFTLITAGLVWLTGPWGMIACGAALGVTILFVIDVEDREREA
jgi:protein-S-isoprenylcysteine O-methyltransferase Ste14